MGKGAATTNRTPGGTDCTFADLRIQSKNDEPWNKKKRRKKRAKVGRTKDAVAGDEPFRVPHLRCMRGGCFELYFGMGLTLKWTVINDRTRHLRSWTR